jgi:hypothetical protein
MMTTAMIVTERITYITYGVFEADINGISDETGGVESFIWATYALTAATNALCTLMVAFKAW